jgi:alpha-glucosidase (family GH31 glycosyl hydrolase)
MPIEFVSDRTTHHLDQQFMLGPSLLVAPVFVPEDEETEYYLPEGRWTSFFTPERVIDGPRWVRERVPLNEIPIWVRQSSVLVLGPEGVEKPDYALNEDMELRVYELAEGQRVEVEVPSGVGKAIAGKVSVERRGGEELVVSVMEGSGVSVASVRLFVDGVALEGVGEDGAVKVNLKGKGEVGVRTVKSG